MWVGIAGNFTFLGVGVRHRGVKGAAITAIPLRFVLV